MTNHVARLMRPIGKQDAEPFRFDRKGSSRRARLSARPRRGRRCASAAGAASDGRCPPAAPRWARPSPADCRAAASDRRERHRPSARPAAARRPCAAPRRPARPPATAPARAGARDAMVGRGLTSTSGSASSSWASSAAASVSFRRASCSRKLSRSIGISRSICRSSIIRSAWARMLRACASWPEARGIPGQHLRERLGRRWHQVEDVVGAAAHAALAAPVLVAAMPARRPALLALLTAATIWKRVSALHKRGDATRMVRSIRQHRTGGFLPDRRARLEKQARGSIGAAYPPTSPGRRWDTALGCSAERQSLRMWCSPAAITALRAATTGNRTRNRSLHASGGQTSPLARGSATWP